MSDANGTTSRQEAEIARWRAGGYIPPLVGGPPPRPPAPAVVHPDYAAHPTPEARAAAWRASAGTPSLDERSA